MSCWDCRFDLRRRAVRPAAGIMLWASLACILQAAEPLIPRLPSSQAPASQARVPQAARPEPPATEQIAARLAAATVTVRVSAGDVPPARAENTREAGDPEDENLPAPAGGVSVASGVAIEKGLVVAFHADPRAQFRLTLPDGRQAQGRLLVVDFYSGLSLLETQADLPGLELAADAPPIGAAVLTAAAAGIEPPAVSLGILGGTDRVLAATGLPPLLQCDVRTTDTSAGAAVVDRWGRLLGIVAVTPDPAQGGWTYAVPASHVQRLLRARAAEKVVVLRRQRPSVGVSFGPGQAEGVVRVDRVAPDGPAAKAGIAPGDVLLEAEGRRIRSAYQAVAIVLKKQPGDKLNLLVERDGQPRRVEVTLAGALELPADALRSLPGARLGPQVQARAIGKGQIELESGATVRELAAQPPQAERLPRDEATLLRKQIEAFGRVIERLQAELARRDEAQRRTNELIESLNAEIHRLREQLELQQSKSQQPSTQPPD